MVRLSTRRIKEIHSFLDKWRKRDGTLKRGAIKAAAEKFNVSRPTIYAVLKEFPKAPEREPRKKPVVPKY